MKKKMLWFSKILVAISLIIAPIVATQINKPTSNLLQNNKIYSSRFLEMDQPEISSELTLLPPKDDGGVPPCIMPGDTQLYYVEEEATDSIPAMIAKVPYCKNVKDVPIYTLIDWHFPNDPIVDINDNAKENTEDNADKESLKPEANKLNVGSYNPINFEVKSDSRYYFKIEYDIRLWVSYKNKYLFVSQDKEIFISWIDVFLNNNDNELLWFNNKVQEDDFPSIYVSAGPLIHGTISAKDTLTVTGMYYISREDMENISFNDYVDNIQININYWSSGGNLTITNSFASIDKYTVQVSEDNINFETIASKSPGDTLKFSDKLDSGMVKHKYDTFSGYPKYYFKKHAGTEIEQLKLDIIEMRDWQFQAWKNMPTPSERLDHLKTLLKVNDKQIINTDLTYSNKYEVKDLTFSDTDTNITFLIGNKYSVDNEYIPVTLHVYADY